MRSHAHSEKRQKRQRAHGWEQLPMKHRSLAWWLSQEESHSASAASQNALWLQLLLFRTSAMTKSDTRWRWSQFFFSFFFFLRAPSLLSHSFQAFWNWNSFCQCLIWGRLWVHSTRTDTNLHQTVSCGWPSAETFVTFVLFSSTSFFWESEHDEGTVPDSSLHYVCPCVCVCVHFRVHVWALIPGPCHVYEGVEKGKPCRRNRSQNIKAKPSCWG